MYRLVGIEGVRIRKRFDSSGLQLIRMRCTRVDECSSYSLDQRNDLIYWVALALGVGATLLSFLIVRSRLGLALQATRDSAGGAKALGVNVWITKMIVWVLVAVNGVASWDFLWLGIAVFIDVGSASRAARR